MLVSPQCIFGIDTEHCSFLGHANYVIRWTSLPHNQIISVTGRALRPTHKDVTIHQFDFSYVMQIASPGLLSRAVSNN
jgi:type VI protein secretion system component Hcp